MLRLVKASKRFGETEVLREVSVDFQTGVVTAIVGANGAGKTTLLNVATGIENPSSGSVWLDSRELTSRGVEAHRNAGVVRTFQEPRVFNDLSVIENVRFSAPSALIAMLCLAFGVGPNRDGWIPGIKVLSLLDDFELGSMKNLLCGNLSYGQRRLVELVTALSSSGVAYLFDEPSAGIVSSLLPVMRSHLRSLAAEGLVVVVVDHDIEFVRSVADVIVFVDRGEIVTSGPSAEVLCDPKIRWRLWGAWGE